MECNSQEDKVCESEDNPQQQVLSAEESTHKEENQDCNLTDEDMTLVDIHILGLF
jgi:hypothetical protein